MSLLFIDLFCFFYINTVSVETTSCFNFEVYIAAKPVGVSITGSQ